MQKLTTAQIAKRTKDYLEVAANVGGLPANHVWRIAYIYADIIAKNYGAITSSDFDALNFEHAPEALEAYEIEQYNAWAAHG